MASATGVLPAEVAPCLFLLTNSPHMMTLGEKGQHEPTTTASRTSDRSKRSRRPRIQTRNVGSTHRRRNPTTGSLASNRNRKAIRRNDQIPNEENRKACIKKTRSAPHAPNESTVTQEKGNTLMNNLDPTLLAKGKQPNHLTIVNGIQSCRC